MLLFIPIFCIGIFTVQVNASGIEKKKSSKMLKKAELAYTEMKYAVAIELYQNSIQNFNDSRPAIIGKLADCYWQIKDYNNALHIYKQIYPVVVEDIDKNDRIRLAKLYARKAEYKLASDWLKDLDGYEAKATAYSENETLNEMKRDSLNWRINSLSINTDYREFSPFVKDNTLFFCSNKALDYKKESFDWDGNSYSHLWQIPVSKVDTIDLLNKVIEQKSTNISKDRKLAEIFECGDSKPRVDNLNIALNKQYIPADKKPIGKIVEGLDKLDFNSGTISIDKKNHILFSANYSKPDKNGINRIQLMEGIYSAKGITKIKELSFGDANANTYSVMHPAINADGTLLVCCSDKPGGKGGFDLYYSTRKSIDQPWDTLQSFGNNINTVGNEAFPSITAKNNLYFSSDAMPGLGGLDIYRIGLKEALSQEGDVLHLDYPINSQADDFGWTESDSKGKKGYFTSDRLKNVDNLFSFNYNPKYAFFEGYVLEKESLNPIDAATVFMYSIKEKMVYVTKSNKNGKYRFPIQSTGKIIVKALDNKHISDKLSSIINFDPQDMDTTFKAPRDLLLDKYKIGFAWSIRDTHYDFDKFDIRQDALPILDSLVSLTYKYSITIDSLVAILKDKPITIEIGSHTDSRGSFEYNDELSLKRSKSVVSYLVQKGIDPKRISSKGYGEYQLLTNCPDGVDCTKEEHQLNRRTEAKITGFTTPQIVIEYFDIDRFKDGDKVDISIFPKGFFEESK